MPKQDKNSLPKKVGLFAEKLINFHGSDLIDLCDACEAAIEAGGGFGWVEVPDRKIMERYWKGVLLVPERTLIVGRLDGVIVGAAQLVRPPANNQAQFFSAQLTGCFVAPWARRGGLGSMMIQTLEEAAWYEGCEIINLDVRATAIDAVQLYESLGYYCWGHHPVYAKVPVENGEEEIIPGRFYYKALKAPEDKASKSIK